MGVYKRTKSTNVQEFDFLIQPAKTLSEIINGLGEHKNDDAFQPLYQIV